MNRFLTNYNITAEIGVALTGSTWTYAKLGAGIDNVAEALNEVIQQYQFLNGQGFAENHVTGAAPAWTLSGRRILGDTAQDYIAGLKYEFDDARKSSLRISYSKGTTTVYAQTITVPVTICNIVDIGGGASTDDSVFSCEIRFDGKPTYTATGLKLFASKVATGSSTVTILNAIVGEAYYYKVGTVDMPAVGTAVSTLTSWTSSVGSTISVTGAVAGTPITVVSYLPAAIGGTNTVIKGGVVIPE